MPIYIRDAFDWGICLLKPNLLRAWSATFAKVALLLNVYSSLFQSPISIFDSRKGIYHQPRRLIAK